MTDYIIIGGGLAGHRAAVELRRLAPLARIRLISAEAVEPYDRPPLSKEYLSDVDRAAPFLSNQEIYDGGVILHKGTAAVAIDRTARSVDLSDGSTHFYDRLLIATGSRLRTLPLDGVDPARIFYLRTLADAQRLRSALLACRSVAVIGGGFIGLEIAAAARRLGRQVTVLEAARTLLSRSSTGPMGGYIRELHAARGVDVVLGAAVDDVSEEPDGALRVRWDSGSVGVDMIVVGIGVMPNVELARASGLAVEDGIVVDEACRTSDPFIYAAGEVTNYPIAHLNLRSRSESWSAAGEQAVVAARAMSGAEARYDDMPWLWSDQYDVNVQTVGLPRLASRYLRIGEISSNSWLQIGLDEEGRLIGAEGVNMGRDISALRRCVKKGQHVPASFFERAVELETQEARG